MLGKEKIQPDTNRDKKDPVISGYTWENKEKHQGEKDGVEEALSVLDLDKPSKKALEIAMLPRSESKEGPIISGYSWENRDEIKNISPSSGFIPSDKAIEVAAQLSKLRASLKDTSSEKMSEKDNSKEKKIVQSRPQKEILEPDIGRRNIIKGLIDNFRKGREQGRQKEDSTLQNDEERNGTTRRDFLINTFKAATALPLTVVAAEYYGIIDRAKDAFRFFQGGDETEEKNKTEETLRQLAEKKAQEALTEQIEKEKENAQAIEKIINYNVSGEIKYDREKAALVENYWLDRFSNKKDRFSGIKSSYARFLPWIEIQGEENIREIFQKEFINKVEKEKQLSEQEKKELFFTYVSLVITESNGYLRKDSWVGAAGPHQFMKKTAQQYKLFMKGNIDERYDPIKSARACARLLNDNYKTYGDLDLALHAYNGMVGRYKTDTDAKSELNHPNYSLDKYYEFASKELDHVRDEIKNSHSLEYEVRTGETLSEIAERYDLSVSAIMDCNPVIKNSTKINENQKIHLPPTEEVKQIFFNDNKIVKGYIENFNYLSKIKSTRKVLLALDEKNELPSVKGRTIVAGHDHVTKIKKRQLHIVRKGEKTIDDVVKSCGATKGELIRRNNFKKNKNGEVLVRTGMKLFFVKEVEPSLKDLSNGNKNKLSRLEALNPKILDSKKSIALGTSYRT